MLLKITRKYEFEKIGVNEIEGLNAILRDALQPIADHIKEGIYWTDKVEITDTEYRSRDGFIPYSHNCGGVEICEIIPECEQYAFSYLEFGEWDGAHYCDDDANKDECDCPYDYDGHYDAKLRIWLKFEGIDANGVMSFYLVMSGGNGDAPYFREKYSSTYFEKSFEAKTLTEVKARASSAVNQLLKRMS